jgi:hypothetical protein
MFANLQLQDDWWWYGIAVLIWINRLHVIAKHGIYKVKLNRIKRALHATGRKSLALAKLMLASVRVRAFMES